MVGRRALRSRLVRCRSGYNAGSMAFTYAIDHANRVAIGTLAGTVRGRDIAAAIRTIYEDAAWEPGFDTFWESTGITELLFEPNDLKSFVGLQSDSAGRSGPGLEIIVVGRSLDEVMAKMYALMMKGRRVASMCVDRWGARLLGRAV